MKRLLFIAAFMFAAVCAKAQFFNGIELGGMIQYTNQHGISNAGLDFTAAKRVAPWSRIRTNVCVNGFIPNGFDRYGYGMVGITAEALPLYIFGDFGLSCNPSGPRTIGLAFDVGVGLQFEVARRWNIYTELAIDRINSGKLWQSTAAVKSGVTYNIL